MPALARFYDPQIGRFLTPDPAGTIDSPNLYAYVLNDPINFTDPSGLCETVTGSRICRSPLTATDTGGIGGDSAGGGGGRGGGGGTRPCTISFGDTVIRERCVRPTPFDPGPAFPISFFDPIFGGGPARMAIPPEISPDPESQPFDPADADRAVLCALPPVGGGIGVDAFALFGATLQIGFSADIARGRFAVFGSAGFGVGLGIGIYGLVGQAPVGNTADAIVGGGVGAGGVGVGYQRSIGGSTAGTGSVTVARVGPELGGNVYLGGAFSLGNTSSLYDLGCPE